MIAALASSFTLVESALRSVETSPRMVMNWSRTSGSRLSIQSTDATTTGADTAIFYSITNCQSGLRGISFGSFLIKQVTERLAAEQATLTTFSTLSPIPGFAAWLAEHHRDIDTGDETAVVRHCANYLLTVRRRNLPQDSVARFHLRNGACVEQINWRGDTSAKGMTESHGLLVNYRYSGQDISANNEALTLDGLVTASKQVADLLNPFDATLVRVSAN